MLCFGKREEANLEWFSSSLSFYIRLHFIISMGYTIWYGYRYIFLVILAHSRFAGNLPISRMQTVSAFYSSLIHSLEEAR
jgi:hypothetical protein